MASSVQVSTASGAAVCMEQEVSSASVSVTAVAPTNSNETAFYVIDRGDMGGFVVMSADDRIEPVLVIAPSGKFDATPGTPLYDLLCGDMEDRLDAAEAQGLDRSEKWSVILDGADGALALSGAMSSIDDVRVEPLVQSQWDQSTIGSKNVYNYYTPNNSVCGCVATAGAQIMRYHEFPSSSVTPVTHTCYYNGSAFSAEMKGGKYNWSKMPLVPTSSISDAECMEIGKLCYDVGVSVYMSWTSGSSGAGSYTLKEAFLEIFGYANAMAWVQQSGTMSDAAIKGALLANFDAGYPVNMSIHGNGGHSIVGDGYGYSGGTLYVHLNMGWSGCDDAWYNLPNIGTGFSFNMVSGAVYNIFTDHTGDLLTGRVLDSESGDPIAGATVQAMDGSTVLDSVTTSANGIFALCLPGGVTYSIAASAPGSETVTQNIYLPKSVSTGVVGQFYRPGTGSVGNSWGNDFSLSTAVEPTVPDAPSGVSASDGTSTAKVRIAWNASSGATYYNVYRSTSNSSSDASVLASSLSGLYYDDTSAEVGTTYYYWIKAGNAKGESGFSASDSGWRAYEIPSAPTGVAASDGTSTAGVTVTWRASSGATSYSVWRSTSSASSSASSIASGLTSTTYTDTSAVAGTTYYYWVKATNQGGTSAFSASDTGYRAVNPPSAPTGVSAADGLSATEIVVSWNAVSSATSYCVWRSTSSESSSATQLASGLTQTSYADSSAASGTTYYYWVKAVNAGGASGFSSSDTGYLAVITGPSSITASDGTYSGYVKLSWTASSGAQSYEVYRSTVNAYSLAVKIASPTSASHNDSTAAPGTLYYYWVRAVTSAGVSSFSASDKGYRTISAPSGVSATSGNTSGVKVSWSAVSGAVSYTVGRGASGESAPSTMLETTTSTSYTDATAVPGVTYRYWVKSVGSACSSVWSSYASGNRAIPTPDSLTATDGTRTDAILVSWPALSGAVRYELRRSSDENFANGDTIATTDGTSFTDRTAEYGLTYYYWLRAEFAAGVSGWSESEAGWRAFPAPAGVTASTNNTSRMTLTWEAIEGASFYQVWRYSQTRGRNELLGTATSATYNDSNSLEGGVKYTYRIKAVFPTGTSAFSAAAVGWIKASSPTPVASDGTSTTKISLTWTEASGAIAYHVYRGTTSSAASATRIATTTDPYYDDTGASQGQLYYYWIVTATPIDVSAFGTSDTGYRALPGVSWVTASDGTSSDKVTISWSGVSGAVSYEVWRSDSDDYSKATRVRNNINALTYDDTTAASGVKFWYWVRAYDAGVGLWGASDSGYRGLASPTDLTATTNLTTGVNLTWKGATTGVWYEIMRSAQNDFNQAVVVATQSAKLNYSDTTAVPGYRYYYWIRAYSDILESDWSQMASGFRAISAPATVSASDGTSLDAVTVTWSSATSAKYYEVWCGTNNQTSAAWLLGSTNKCEWVDTKPERGVLYYYWIKSVSAIDTSAYSALDTGYVSTLAPTGIEASDGTMANCVNIVWEPADGALTYTVWRAESDSVDAATSIKTGITTTSYNDTTAVAGKFYWYWVRPVSKAGQGVFAGPDRGYRALTAPTNVVATSNSNARVTVSWKRSDGATSYEIFRAESDDAESATNVVFDTTTNISFNDTNAVPAVMYWYWVRACAEADTSALGGPGNGYRLLAAPATVTASDGTSDEFIQVTWTESIGATSYEVWRAQASTATKDARFVASVTNELEYIDTEAVAGISHTYWIKAVSNLHTTDLSANDRGWRSLPAPTAVSASDGTSSDGVVIEWEIVNGATKYEIWRCEGDEASTNKAARVYSSSDAFTTTYIDTGAKAGVRYWYWVRTVGATGTGIFSKADDGFRAIAVPTNVAATDGTSYANVRVSWNNVSGATSYEICRAEEDLLEFATNDIIRVTGTTYDDTNAVPGTVYYYWVRAGSSMSTSAWAGPDSGYRKFSKPTDVAASDGTSLDAVEVTWTAVEGGVKYKVWRSTGTSVSSASEVAEVESTSCSDTGAVRGVKYYYWVNAVSDVDGEFSAYNDGWRGLLPPESVEATDGDSTSHVRITWAVSPDATKYEILRSESADTETPTSIKTLNSPSTLAWEDTTATPGTLYYYWVRSGGTGGWSASGEPDTGYKALMPPSSVSATDGTQNRKVIVSWGSVNGATYYRVYRAATADSEKVALGDWQSATSFTDSTCVGTTKYWYYVIAAVDASGARPSTYSAGDAGYAKDDGSADPDPVDLGGGITLPVTDNGDGTCTTNSISYTSISDGALTFGGVSGAVGSTTRVYALVKTSLEGETYTVPATLKVVELGTAQLDLSEVWGKPESLFVIGIDTEPGTELELEE